MMKGSLRRLFGASPVLAAITVLAACGSGDALDIPAQQALSAGAGVSTQVAAVTNAYTDTVPSTMIELQHFDAYQYYRDVFDLHVDAAQRVVADGVAGSLRGNSNGDDAEHIFFSCFRSRAFN